MHTRRSLQSSLFLVVPAALALGWTATVAADDADQKFPATGQTTVYHPGDDGDIQAGATLSYKDNGNGTIRDRNTRLVWEKKSDDDSIHDKDNPYTWDEAFDVHVATLNNICANDESIACTRNADCAGVAGKCGFAGKRGWRLPNVKELQSIVNDEIPFPDPLVSPAFNLSCDPGDTVLDDGSCTAASVYWSSTTHASLPGFAWAVNFVNGDVNADGKGFGLRIRAVRGGSP